MLSAREVVELYNLVVWNKRDFALAGYPVKAMHYVKDNGLLGTRLLTSDADSGRRCFDIGPVFTPEARAS